MVDLSQKNKKNKSELKEVEFIPGLGGMLEAPLKVDSEKLAATMNEDHELDVNIMNEFEKLKNYLDPASQNKVDEDFLKDVINPLLIDLDATYAEAETYLFYKMLHDIELNFNESEEGKKFREAFSKGEIGINDPMLLQYTQMMDNLNAIKGRAGESSSPLVKEVETKFGSWLTKQSMDTFRTNEEVKNNYLRIKEKFSNNLQLIKDHPVMSILFLQDPIPISKLGLNRTIVFVSLVKMLNGCSKEQMEAIQYWSIINKRLIKSPDIIKLYSDIRNRTVQFNVDMDLDISDLNSFETNMSKIFIENKIEETVITAMKEGIKILGEKLKKDPPKALYEAEYLSVTHQIKQFLLTDIHFQKYPLSLIFLLEDKEAGEFIKGLYEQEKAFGIPLQTITKFLMTDEKKALMNKIKKSLVSEIYKTKFIGYLTEYRLNEMEGIRTKGHIEDVKTIMSRFNNFYNILQANELDDIINYIHKGGKFSPPPPPPPPPPF